MLQRRLLAAGLHGPDARCSGCCAAVSSLRHQRRWPRARRAPAGGHHRRELTAAAAAAAATTAPVALRNVGILAHIDAGKTTTTERMLFYTGRETSMGNVDDGDTTTDFLTAERERGITIQSAAVTLEWNDAAINLIDTPGHVDFTFEVERSLRVLDGAVIALDGVAGVQVQSEKVWRQADRYRIPRLIYINKLDRQGADVRHVLNTIEAAFRVRPLLAQLPLYRGSLGGGAGDSSICGVFDLVSMQALEWDAEVDPTGREYSATPLGCEDLAQRHPSLAESAAEAREALVTAAAECDEELMEELLMADLETSAVESEALRAGLRRITIANGVAAAAAGKGQASVESTGAVVLLGASLRNVGVQPLLDAVVDYLPSPFDEGRQRVAALELPPAGQPQESKLVELECGPDPSAALRALAFKVVHDARRGPIVFVRVYSGQLVARSVIANVSGQHTPLLSGGEVGSSGGGGGGGRVVQQNKERVMKLLHVYADSMTEVDTVDAGHICAIVGLKHTRTGDTLIGGADAKRSKRSKGGKKGSGGSRSKGQIVLAPIVSPEPVFCAAIEAESNEELVGLRESLDILVREDPSVGVSVDAQTAQLLLHGMGELHLEVVHDRLVRDFGLSGVTMSSVRIAYKEGVRSAAEVTSEWSRELPGTGQTIASTIAVRVEPSPAGGGNMLELGPGVPSVEELDDHVMDALREGCADAWSRGPISGYGLMGVKVTILSAEHELSLTNTVDAIRFAASEAVSEAVSHADANAGMMEPIMRVEVAVSDKFVGAVLNDLTGQRRGVVLTVSGDDDNPGGGSGGGAGAVSLGRQTVEAEVPLKELVAYSTALRSLTQGGGDFTMALARYDFAIE